MSRRVEERPDSFHAKRRKRNYIDYGMLFCVFLLIAFGLVMIFSTTAYQKGWSDLRSQFISTMIGIGLMIFVYKFPFKNFNNIEIKIWKEYKIGLLDFAVLFIMLVSILLLLSPIKYSSHNATRWFKIGGANGFTVQSAEIVKLGMIMVLASFLSKKREPLENLVDEGIMFAIVGAYALFLGVVSNNMSSGLIIGFIGAVMIFTVSPRSKYYLYLAGGVAAIAAFVVFLVQRGVDLGFRGRRIKIWLNPEATDIDIDNFQVIQGLYAIGSGGLKGKGIGESIQKLNKIPEAQNDMIFSVLCEELGFIGALVIMFLFTVLIFRLMILARSLKNRYDKLIVTGVLAHVAIQAILNIAVVTNTIPNTGVSLPFISSGGSSVLCLLVEFGLVLNVCKGLKYGNEEESQ